MILYAEEDDANAFIDWSKKITQIETFNSSYHTAKGRHPESPVQDVEKVLGKVKEALNKLIPFMVRQAHHERNQQLTVRLSLDHPCGGACRRTYSELP
jgi:hypothetical protein